MGRPATGKVGPISDRDLWRGERGRGYPIVHLRPWGSSALYEHSCAAAGTGFVQVVRPLPPDGLNVHGDFKVSWRPRPSLPHTWYLRFSEFNFPSLDSCFTSYVC